MLLRLALTLDGGLSSLARIAFLFVVAFHLAGRPTRRCGPLRIPARTLIESVRGDGALGRDLRLRLFGSCVGLATAAWLILSARATPCLQCVPFRCGTAEVSEIDLGISTSGTAADSVKFADKVVVPVEAAFAGL